LINQTLKTFEAGEGAQLIRIDWISDDADEADYVAAARLPGVPPLDVRWFRTLPPLDELAACDVLVADPGALREHPAEFERRVHADRPSLPVVFYSGLRPEHHLRGGSDLVWAIPAVVTWLAQVDAPLLTELPRRLSEIAAASGP
jgi:hypothetical protein